MYVSNKCKKTCGKCKTPEITVVDCTWSPWNKWSSCSKTCGIGLQERNRTKVKRAQNGGKECNGANKETRLCNKQKCPGTII